MKWLSPCDLPFYPNPQRHKNGPFSETVAWAHVWPLSNVNAFLMVVRKESKC